jgi:hypothetical protein
MRGSRVCDDAAPQVKETVTEIQHALSGKRTEAASADRCLTSDIYLSLFCHLYTLTLLVISRHHLSMEADRCAYALLCKSCTGVRERVLGLGYLVGLWPNIHRLFEVPPSERPSEPCICTCLPANQSLSLSLSLSLCLCVLVSLEAHA